MSLKITGKTTDDTLTEKFDKDAKLLEDASSLITFAATAAAGEPLSIAAGIALIVKTAGSALSAGANLVRRFAADEVKGQARRRQKSLDFPGRSEASIGCGQFHPYQWVLTPILTSPC